MVTETRDHRKAKEISLKQDREGDGEGGRNDETREIKAGTKTNIMNKAKKQESQNITNFKNNKRQTQTPRTQILVGSC